MGDRILLGQRGPDYGLWVSRPGVDVKTASPADLLFSSDWSALNVLATGTHTVNWNSSSYSIPLGVTFPTLPYMVFERAQFGQYRLIGRPDGFRWERLVYEARGLGHAIVTAAVGTSTISITTDFWGIISTVNPPTFQFRYQVLNYNL